MNRLSPMAVGVFMMLAGMFLFASNDALGKWLVSSYSVGQVLLIRSLAAFVILLPFILRFGWRQLVRLDRPGIQALRVVLATAEVFCFYYAVRYMPLADTMTFWLASPIYVALLAPFFLGETIGALRWVAILLGFVGVVLVLAPAGGLFGWASVVAIAGSLCFALMMISARFLRGTPDVALVFWQLVGAAVAGALAAPTGWIMPVALDWGLLALVGVVAMGAHICVNRAMKMADTPCWHRCNIPCCSGPLSWGGCFLMTSPAAGCWWGQGSSFWQG